MNARLIHAKTEVSFYFFTSINLNSNLFIQRFGGFHPTKITSICIFVHICKWVEKKPRIVFWFRKNLKLNFLIQPISIQYIYTPGTCEDMLNGYQCHCILGYNGTNCENNIDECSSRPCLNRATCEVR